MYARLRGWNDRRFDLTPTASAFVLSPGRELLTSAVHLADETGLANPGLVIRIADGASRHLSPFQNPVWQDALARLILGRTERRTWRELAANPHPGGRKRRWEWLLGRLAAKDAARNWVRLCGGPDHLLPADIEIGSSAEGQPCITSQLPGVTVPPVISISHSGPPSVAAAVCGDGARLRGVGIDIERRRELASSSSRRRSMRASGPRSARASGSSRDGPRRRRSRSRRAAAKAHSAGASSRQTHPERSASRHVGEGAEVLAQTSGHDGLVVAIATVKKQSGHDGRARSGR